MSPRTPMPETLSLYVPFRFVKRGGRKEMQLPEGAPQAPKPDSTLVKALVRAFRWKRMLDTGEFATIAELAKHEGIALSYVTRILQLTMLAPDLVEAILDGRQCGALTMRSFQSPIPSEWQLQRSTFSN